MLLSISFFFRSWTHFPIEKISRESDEALAPVVLHVVDGVLTPASPHPCEQCPDVPARSLIPVTGSPYCYSTLGNSYCVTKG
jgi:hypothetical protein